MASRQRFASVIGIGREEGDDVDAAAARPQATPFGAAAYPSLQAQAAALLHSIVRNHALMDGNKRLGLAAVLAFYGLNGYRLTMTNDEAYDFIVAIAAGEPDDVGTIADRLAVAARTSRS